MVQKLTVCVSLLAASCSKSQGTPSSDSAADAASTRASPEAEAEAEAEAEVGADAQVDAQAQVELDLGALLKDQRRSEGAVFAPPDAGELTRFSSLVAKVVEAPHQPASLPGFLVVRVGSGRAIIQAERRRGAPVVAVREQGRVIVQAPHTFFDLGTLPIALAIYERPEARALIVNTMHRSEGSDREERVKQARSGQGAANVARAEHSFFQAAHDVLLQTVPSALVVQVHGFADATVPEADIVLSAAGSSQELESVKTALAAVVPAQRILSYPRDVKRLGATKNVQARSAVEKGVPFLHVELSRSLRSSLTQDFPRRVRFAQALLRGLKPR